jgi:hypothetical protein
VVIADAMSADFTLIAAAATISTEKGKNREPQDDSLQDARDRDARRAVRVEHENHPGRR